MPRKRSGKTATRRMARETKRSPQNERRRQVHLLSQHTGNVPRGTIRKKILQPPLPGVRILRKLRLISQTHQRRLNSGKSFTFRNLNVLHQKTPKQQTPTPCRKRLTRKAVLFQRKLVGFAGSSPGKNHTYRRTNESQGRCK